MDELLESLLQCSRLGRAELKREMIDLNLLLNQAIETIEHQLESPNITVRAVSALPTTVCDASQIQQVFVNLIVNGLKYNSSPEKVIEVGYQKEPEEAIFVRDNGIGIAEGNHQEVFKIFRRLHGKNEFGGGSGAGLTIVQKIVQQHGGRIWLESAPTKGTTFFFTLPGEQMVIGESSRATAI
jgi:signal transduction histidine kinase